jgi:hypothetical protein
MRSGIKQRPRLLGLRQIKVPIGVVAAYEPITEPGAISLAADLYPYPVKPVDTLRLASIGLNASTDGTDTLRRTKAPPIYQRTKNLHTAQLVPRHTKLQSTVPHIGVQVNNALEIVE